MHNPSEVLEVMTPDPATIRPDDHLLDAAARMVQLRVRHLPVVAADGVLVGMLSDRDIRQVVGDPFVSFGADAPIELETLKVADCMSREPIVADATATLGELARLLCDLEVSAVPVVDEDRRPIGIVSYVDVLRAYASREP
jgi:CBS domain-containing protein